MLGIGETHIVEPLTVPLRDAPPPLPTGTIESEEVPEAVRPQPVRLVRLLLPIVMIAAMLGMVALMVLGAGDSRHISPVSLMFPLMMLASMAMMFGPQNSGQDPDETRRTYLRHIKALREKALDNAGAQRAHELYRHPDPAGLEPLVGSRRMWERGPDDPDALEVRVGTGPTTLCTPINVPDSGATEDLDPVCAVSMRQAIKAVGTVPDLPVVIQLQAFRFLSFTGDNARDTVRALVMQLALAHGPETIGIEAIGGEWEWLKWLPHTREPDKARFRIVLVDALLTTGTEDFFHSDSYTTVIEVGGAPSSALSLRAEQEGLCLVAADTLQAVTAAGVEELGTPDYLGTAAATIMARRMAVFRRPDSTSGRRGNDLLGLLGYSGVDELAASGMWHGRDGASRLMVPIGIDSIGQPVTLDLKESAHGGMGPHGLCIGATGSGKSELLRTLVTALAATHSPDELNLVLVDFKGGATFLGCDRLPHTSAVITNLEEESTLVERMYDAISGEMNRRQELLRTAGNFANVGEYNASADAVRDYGPLPALVIVVDEFSELLGQHPDFAELFVAVGRLGRSLHVHLLLASQRLEEGRLRGLDSHLSYRIGLKTFSSAESRQVLGVTDAYHLPGQPGAGYLKSDAEDLTRFQASYVSGPLARRVAPGAGMHAATDLEGNPSGPPRRVELFTGWAKDDAAVQNSPAVVMDESTSVLTEVVRAAGEEAAARGQEAHRIWLPPLPPVIELSSLEMEGAESTAAELSVPIGIIDRPYYQRQDQLVIDFHQHGGHLALCGGPQSGKSGALRTIVSSLALHLRPEDIRFYVIDLGGGQLTALDRLPHVAGVAGREEGEKIRRIVDEVAGFIRRPESRETFLIIDGWHHIGPSNAEFEDIAESITDIVADGASANVHVVIATSRWTTMRPAIRDLIAHRLELRLGEALDSLIDRKLQQKLPSAPGRGLTQAGENMLLAHTSNQDIAHICRVHANAVPAPRLKMLPAVLTPEVLAAHGEAPTGGIPWGIGGRDLSTLAWNPEREPHLVAIGAQGCGKSNFLAQIMRGVSSLPREEARLVVIDQRRAHLGTLDPDMVAAYAATQSSAQEEIVNTVRTLEQRLPGADITPEQLAARDWWEGPDIYVVIDDADLVSDIALAPLIDLLPHARDIGLHMVIARKSGGIGRALFGQFFSAVRDLQPAFLLFDADRDEGTIFGLKPSHQPPGRGQWSIRGENLGIAQVVYGEGKE
ncbi:MULTISPECIES: type VII secretion protein EccCa [unclassified Corynebacterium]|uniref:type VII secretion protein EccCa n=1 Tax=Corynebacterium TaxID=1716 RepID=UPI0025513FBC|nr:MULTISPECIES: type VII secretion protein EccCa [unclassified Corynebacterium]MDK8451705.1 type VII secretion protein EccCa [Corynebacterium sp. MSK084]MDK8475830.1 type VII secretion protein EccCa [Corynebacterium sp. MSK310]MDK8490640.1 type VII secretion protein EccCa [Corynebacterium sp. MSK175]MDK8513641.1 type VII secretion protein EccCa [Corynebacterium sp. MSK123]MDK8546983.1 type VII secretion protein EccCa [Corynebacterium sp. MSK222]